MNEISIILSSCSFLAFWGEEEIQVVANMGPAKDLPNIWPTTGLLGFEMNSPLNTFIVGASKLVAISFTVSGGLRGGESCRHTTVSSIVVRLSRFVVLSTGYIFPLMCSGSAFGRLLYFILPDTIPMQLAVLCTAAGMNVAITRTSLATTLILAFLPGEPCAIPAILMASICSLFATSYMVRLENCLACDPYHYPCTNLTMVFSLSCLRSRLSKARSLEVTLTTVFFTKNIISQLMLF